MINDHNRELLSSTLSCSVGGDCVGKFTYWLYTNKAIRGWGAVAEHGSPLKILKGLAKQYRQIYTYAGQFHRGIMHVVSGEVSSQGWVSIQMLNI